MSVVKQPSAQERSAQLVRDLVEWVDRPGRYTLMDLFITEAGEVRGTVQTMRGDFYLSIPDSAEVNPPIAAAELTEMLDTSCRPGAVLRLYVDRDPEWLSDFHQT